MKKIYCSLLILAASLFVVGCGPTPVAKKERAKSTVMVDYSKVGAIDVHDAKTALRQIGASDQIVETLTSDVAIYHITYHSTYRGDSVILSGFVAMPNDPATTDTLRHIHYNHGTLTPFANARGMGINDTPTLYAGRTNVKDSMKKSLEARLFGIGLAGNGFLVTIPDYAGYGESKSLEHPYMYIPELEIEATDMLIAARELGKVLEFGIEEGVYLCGWSQGAALALAQQQFMEREHPEIPILGTAALAGPYNLSQYAKSISADNQPMNGLISWMIYSHLMFGGDTSIIKPNTIWLNPVADQYDAFESLHQEPGNKIFAPQLLNNRATATKLLSKSDLRKDWTPKAPIWLHHGTKDPMVDYSQSTAAQSELQKMGANQVNLVTYTDGNHYSVLGDYFKFIVETFKK